MRLFLTTGLALLLLAGTAFAKTSVADAEKRMAKNDYKGVFKILAKESADKESGVDDAVAAWLEKTRAAAEPVILATIQDPDAGSDPWTGAVRAAGRLQLASALPAIEARLAGEKNWRKRFTLAFAVLRIDQDSSRPAVVAALRAETHSVPIIALAEYLQKHPLAGALALVKEQYKNEFAKARKLERGEPDYNFAIKACAALQRAKSAIEKLDKGK